MAREATRPDFYHLPSAADMVWKDRDSPQRRGSRATVSTEPLSIVRTSSLRSSLLSMSDGTQPHPGDEIYVVHSSPAATTDYPDEVFFYSEGAGAPLHVYEGDRDAKEAKDKKKKKKSKESKRFSSERASSKLTMETMVSLETPGSERKEPRDRAPETKEERRARHERRKQEELENPELKRERRERRKHRTTHRRSSNRGGIPHEVDHLLGGHPIPTELHLIPEMIIEQPADLPLPQEHWRAAHRRGPETDVPRTIEVIINSLCLSDFEQDIPDQQNRKSSKYDYDRLMQMLEEEDEMPALHPLIAASDENFQEAFDALARDSVFDDNFEKAFNEFSEHYLALSPWSEDDSIKDNCEKHHKSNQNQQPYGEEDFIQIPPTPMSRRELTGYISKDSKPKSSSKKEVTHKGDFEDMPRKPVVQKGVLSSKSLEIISEKYSKKEVTHKGDFEDMPRKPIIQKAVIKPIIQKAVISSKSLEIISENSSKKEVTHKGDFEDMPRKPITQKGVISSKSLEIISETKRTEVGDEFVEISRTPFSHPREPESPDQEDDADKGSCLSRSTNNKVRKWKILRGRRSTTSV